MCIKSLFLSPDKRQTFPAIMHIAIIGNIGAGKTTLTQMLGEHYKWDVMYEAVEGNPYLVDFYSDMERWAFNLQIYFLNNRFESGFIERSYLLNNNIFICCKNAVRPNVA